MLTSAEHDELRRRLTCEADVRRECVSLGLPYVAARAVWLQSFQRLTRAGAPRLREALPRLRARWEAGEATLLELARTVPVGNGRQRYSPFLVAKKVLEACGARRKEVEALLDEAEAGRAPEGGRAAQLKECADADPHYSPAANRLRRVAGLEYEYRLQESVRALGLAFLSEDDLKRRGDAKTPDVVVTSPFFLADGGGGTEGGEEDGPQQSPPPQPVCWIDSKAVYGGPQEWADHRGQLSGYVSRYGPGMVIYWYGHVSDLAPLAGVVVAGRFPDRRSAVTVASAFAAPAAT